jgi:hypothetical protein
MDDLNDPRISAYKPQRRLRVPAPPGPHKMTEAQRHARRDRQARAEARAARFHLVGLASGGTLVMGVILAVVVVMLVLVLVSRHH